MITRARKHLIVALILPLLVLQAMLPAGYMPSFDGGQLRIVMCSAGLAAISSQDQDGGAPADAPVCGFAAAGIAGPPPALNSLSLPVAGDGEPAAAHACVAFAPTVKRCQSSRGPPAA